MTQETPLFDAHTHLQFPPFDADRSLVIERSRAAHVKMILVGTQETTSVAGVKLAEQYPGEMWAAVGFHPAHASDRGWYHDKNEQTEPKRESFDSDRMKALALHSQTVAIGECGLDYFRAPTDTAEFLEIKKAQENLFIAQAELSKEVQKPLMIHCRRGVMQNAFRDLAEILQSFQGSIPPSVIHFFTGTPDDARMLLDLGSSFTFGGVTTFSHDYDDVIKMIPLDRILSETDAPYVAPAPYRGKRNEPAYVVEAVRKLAELKNVSVEQMAREIWANAERIFGI